MLVSHDPSCRMTKLSCINKHFQIEVEKRLVNFHCRAISLCKEFTVLIFKCVISENRMH